MGKPETEDRNLSINRIQSSHGSYSESVAVTGSGRWLHVAGQLGVDFDGTGAEDPLGIQAGRAFGRLADALAAEGATLGHIVSLVTYVTSFDDWAQLVEVRSELFDGPLPASTAVQVSGLIGGASVEIAAVAFVSDEA
jgi:2-iminobutanoate/2-iminopropanoate deaminase